MSAITEFLWRRVARIACRPKVRDWLIRRAMRTPYAPITGPDGSLYMRRFWLFNPYPSENDGDGRRWTWLPSIRIHHIVRPDSDRALHDHPWHARTIILEGYYVEELPHPWPGFGHVERFNFPGDTNPLRFGEYHRIDTVSPGGVWTLFIAGKRRGTWGFLVDGRKVPWREYLGVPA